MTMTRTSDPAVSAELIALADRLADAAAAVVRRHYRQAVAIDDKDDASPVTIADRQAERVIRDVLTAERPDDGIIGEEHGVERSEAPLVWVIDPIDGTRAFVTGRPTFGTLIALLRNGSPVLGVIDQAVIGDRWIGAVGHPTLLNGLPCRTRACPSLDRAILATTAPDPFSDAGAAAFDRLRRGVRFPIYGGDCLNYGLLAGGFLDLVVEEGLKLYDFAALVPVVAGAGGTITDWQGRPLTAGSDGKVLAAGDRACHTAALARLNDN